MTVTAAAQLWHSAYDISARIAEQNELCLESRLSLQRVLEQLLLTDLDYALEKHADTLLWNGCHKRYIDKLQHSLRKKRRDEDQATLNMLLSAAYGSLYQLLVKATSVYEFENSFILTDHQLGSFSRSAPRLGSTCVKTPKKANVERFVNFCLVHLGDIARYQKDLDMAEFFYGRAIVVNSCDGHPWNQLGVLETARHRQLAAIYYYIRAVSVENQFPPASANLDRFYAHAAVPGLDTLDPSRDHCETFLSFHANCHKFLRLKSLKRLVAKLTSLVDTCTGLKSADWLKMFIVNLAAVHKLDIVETADERTVMELVNGMIAGQYLQMLLVCSQLPSFDLLGPYAQAILTVSTWLVYNYEKLADHFCDRKILLKLLCDVCRALRDLIDADIMNSCNYGEVVELNGFVPLGDLALPTEDLCVEALSSCRRLVSVVVRSLLEEESSSSSVEILEEFGRLEENDLWPTIVRRVFKEEEDGLLTACRIPVIDTETSNRLGNGGRSSSLPSSTFDKLAGTASPAITEERAASESPSPNQGVRRKTKCVPLLQALAANTKQEATVIDIGGQKSVTDKDVAPLLPVSEPTRGLLKVTLPPPEEKKPDDDVSSDPLPSVKFSNQPPRFQAQRLKQALAGGGAASPGRLHSSSPLAHQQPPLPLPARTTPLFSVSTNTNTNDGNNMMPFRLPFQIQTANAPVWGSGQVRAQAQLSGMMMGGSRFTPFGPPPPQPQQFPPHFDVQQPPPPSSTASCSNLPPPPPLDHVAYGFGVCAPTNEHVQRQPPTQFGSMSVPPPSLPSGFSRAPGPPPTGAVPGSGRRVPESPQPQIQFPVSGGPDLWRNPFVIVTQYMAAPTKTTSSGDISDHYKDEEHQQASYPESASSTRSVQQYQPWSNANQ